MALFSDVCYIACNVTVAMPSNKTVFLYSITQTIRAVTQEYNFPLFLPSLAPSILWRLLQFTNGLKEIDFLSKPSMFLCIRHIISNTIYILNHIHLNDRRKNSSNPLFNLNLLSLNNMRQTFLREAKNITSSFPSLEAIVLIYQAMLYSSFKSRFLSKYLSANAIKPSHYNTLFLSMQEFFKLEWHNWDVQLREVIVLYFIGWCWI